MPLPSSILCSWVFHCWNKSLGGLKFGGMCHGVRLSVAFSKHERKRGSKGRGEKERDTEKKREREMNFGYDSILQLRVRKYRNLPHLSSPVARSCDTSQLSFHGSVVSTL